MITAVVFDMDGLLINSEVLTYEIYKEVSLKYNREFDLDFYKSLLGSNAVVIKQALQTYFEDEKVAEIIIEEVHEALNQHFEYKGIPLKEGADYLVKHLAENNIMMAVATSSSRNRAIKILDKTGLLGYFDTVVCGDDVKNSKPDPEIFLKAIEQLGSKPHESIVLEDSENGIVGASSAKIRCINIPDMKQPSEVIYQKADYILNNLTEVPGYLLKM